MGQDANPARRVLQVTCEGLEGGFCLFAALRWTSEILKYPLNHPHTCELSEAETEDRMPAEIAVPTPQGKRADLSLPYPPSVVDRFMAWADRLPGPVWAFYLALLVLLILVINGITWLDESVPFGTFDLYRTSVPFYPVAVLALMHYLNRVAQQAHATFRPAWGGSRAEYAVSEYELTTLPWRWTWVVLGLSLLFTAAYTAFTPYLTDAFQRSPALFVVDLAIYMVSFGMIAVFVYHTLHQLHRVSRIHARAKNVNLFLPAPLYAFSGLTAQTGMGLLLLDYFGVLTDPATFENPALTALTIGTALVAVAAFVWPLRGMHHRIVLEKRRLRAEANARLEATIQQVYGRADTHDLKGMYQLNQLMMSLVATREVLDGIPTWPWETSTLTAFLTAFLLPLAVGIIARLVGEFLA